MSQPLFARHRLTGFIGDERNCKLHFTASRILLSTQLRWRQTSASFYLPSIFPYFVTPFESSGKGIKRTYQIEVLKSSRSMAEEDEGLKTRAHEKEREREIEMKVDARRWDETVLPSPTISCIRSLDREISIFICQSWNDKERILENFENREDFSRKLFSEDFSSKGKSKLYSWISISRLREVQGHETKIIV